MVDESNPESALTMATPGLTAPPVVVVMGVSGCGKSTVASALARALGVPMLEGDDWHAPGSVSKMAAGIPLTDVDRIGWLECLAQQLAQKVRLRSGCVLACSALRRSYRDTLREGAPDLLLLHLQGARAVLEERIHARRGHYMPASLLDSQLATLESPQPGENALMVAMDQPVERIVATTLRALAAPTFPENMHGQLHPDHS